MTLTPAETKLLSALSRVVGSALPMNWLKPAQRQMVKRMRSKGLISKRNRNWAALTEKGKRASHDH